MKITRGTICWPSATFTFVDGCHRSHQAVIDSHSVARKTSGAVELILTTFSKELGSPRDDAPQIRAAAPAAPKSLVNLKHELGSCP